MKVCNKCGVEKPFVDFYKHKLTSDGFRGECKACVKLHNQNYHIGNKARSNKRNTEYYWNNLEIAKKRVKEYRKRHPESNKNFSQKRRAIAKGNGTFFVSNKETKKMYESPCFYCGSTENITIDHVLPIMRGGTHGIGNLVPACRDCNFSKNKKTVMEWRIYKIRQAMLG